MDNEIKKILKILLKISITVMAMVAVYLLFVYIFPILGKILAYIPYLFLPFIFAILIALLVEPVVCFFEIKLRFERTLAVISSLLLVIGGFIYIVSLIVSVTIRQLSSLYRIAQSHSDQMIAQLIGSISDLRLFYLRLDLPPQVQQTLQSNLQKAVEWG